MNVLCFSVAVFPRIPKCPPFASRCLLLSRKRGADVNKGLRHRTTCSSRKTWFLACKRRSKSGLWMRTARNHALYEYTMRQIGVP